MADSEFVMSEPRSSSASRNAAVSGQVDTAAAPVSIPGYRLTDVLGRGAMGIVFLAERLSDKQPVALKTVRATTASTLASIRREILALSRIQHPGVARIIDHGVSDGLPWYAMELLQGRTLRDVIQEQFGGRGMNAPQGQVASAGLEVLHALCNVLAFLHSHGIVHRDLKPENVFVRVNGTPVLVDFGIAINVGSSTDCDISENIIEFAGTPEYMAPEQIQGRGLDARADLYALGCMLFECLTGRPPFEGKTLGAVVSRHLSATPPAPSAYSPSVPRELDDLVLSLLRKKPSDRLGYADDVGAKLTALGVPKARYGEQAATRAYVYRPEFVGRNDVMARFEPLFRGSDGSERRVLVEGESGVGKSRLLVELAAQAAFRGCLVIPVQCLSQGLGGAAVAPPLHAFRSFFLRVADDVRERGAERYEQLLGPRARVLAPYEPAIQALLGHHEHGSIAPAANPDAARTKVFAALRDTLFAFADGRPLLLLVDDLQWADELTASFLESLEPTELVTHEVYVVAASRSDEPLPSTSLAAKFERIGLDRLDREAVGKMVGAMLALQKTPAIFGEFLFRESGGNPFLVAEYVRAAIEQGFLRRDELGRWRLRDDQQEHGLFLEPFSAPPSARSMMLRRISGLGPVATRLVWSAAVLGQDFDAEFLESLAGTKDSLELEALRHRKIFESSEAGRWKFGHDKLRELTYSTIPPLEAANLHRRAAEALEANDSSREPGSWPVLANHWLRGDVPERAAAYSTMAADRARDVHANGDALALYNSALEAARASQSRASADQDSWQLAVCQLEERRADLFLVLGSDEPARAALLDALEHLPGPWSIWRSRLLVKCAQTLERAHRHRDALEYYRQAEAALGNGAALTAQEPPLRTPGGWPIPVQDASEDAYWNQWVSVQVERVWAHYWLADVEAMEELVRRVRPIVEQRGTPLQHARFLQAVIHHDLRRDRYAVSDDTVRHARASLAAAEQSHNFSAISYAQFVLGFQLVFSGALEAARPFLDSALSRAERTGDLGLQTRCLTYSTVLYRLEGDLDRTRETAHRCLQLATRLSMGDYIGAAHANLGWVAFRSGDSPAMRQATDAALEHWARLAPKYPYPFQWLARLHRIAADLEAQDDAQAVENARVILGPVQHRLPAPIMSALSQATEAASAAHLDQARESLGLALTHARKFRLL